MWMKYKVKKDITLPDLLKRFRNKDIDVILQHPKNQAAVKAYKARQPIPKGTVVWLLDPGVTVYITTHPNGRKEVLSQKEWKASVAKAHKAMDMALRTYKSMFETMVYRHDLQNKVIDEFPIVSFFTSNWVGSKGDEPVTQKKAAAAAVKKLQSVVKARDYSKFEAAARDADRKVRAYGKGIDEWVAQHTGSAENWETGLTVVRDGAFVVFGALAMTVAAPATGAATLGYGALVGGGTSLMSSSANEAGRHWADPNLKYSDSAAKIAKDVALGSVFGAAGAGLARLISGALAGKFAERLANSQTISRLISRLSSARWFPEMGQRIYQRELSALMKSLSLDAADDITGALLTITPQVLDRMAVNVTIKVLSRGGVGGAKKITQEILKGNKGSAWVRKFFRDNAAKIKGKMSDDQIADLMATELMKDPLAAEAFEALAKGNVKLIEAELTKEIRKELTRKAREVQKKAKQK